MHRVVWTIALAATLAAVLAVGVRERDAQGGSLPGEAPAVLAVARAIEQIAHDPSGWEKRTQSAVRAASVAVETGEVRSAEGYYVLAFQYQRERNVPDATLMYRRAMVLRPEWAWPYVGLGSLVGRLDPEQREEGITLVREGIALQPDWYQAHDVLAQLLRAAGRLEEARKEAKYALDLHPDDIATQNNYANLLVSMGELAEAEKHYRQAIALGPDHPKPYYNLACVYTLMGRTDDALKYLAQGIDLAPVLRSQAAQDTDLTALRTHPDFRRLVFGEEPKGSDDPGSSIREAT
jgi:Tfp pilus assembly protein PilF